MREIKFRGFDNRHHVWRCGSLRVLKCFQFPGSTNSEILFYDECGNCQAHWVDPETVGQYTGLKDKAGVKIFEGDIVNKGDFIGKVLYDAPEFCVRYVNYFPEIDSLYGGNVYEIIGNVYEHPELLKDAKADENKLK